MASMFDATGNLVIANLDDASPKYKTAEEKVDDDRREFSRMLEAELPFLRRNAGRWHREPADADDLVQETILRALSSAHLWQPGTNLRAWLVTIMRNQFF